MKRFLAAVLFASVSAGAHAAQCDSLSSRNHLVLYGDETPLSQVVRTALDNTGWTLDFKRVSAEPVLKGRIEAPVDEAIVSAVYEAVKQGWKINLAFDQERCQVNIAVRNADAYGPTSIAVSADSPTRRADGAVIADIPDSAEHIAAHRAAPAAMRAHYTVASGEKLSTVLKRWTKQSGGDAVWRAQRDFVIQAAASFNGDLMASISALIESLGEDASSKLLVRVYGNGYVLVEDSAEVAR
jgi:hypothetical protein